VLLIAPTRSNYLRSLLWPFVGFRTKLSPRAGLLEVLALDGVKEGGISAPPLHRARSQKIAEAISSATPTPASTPSPPAESLPLFLQGVISPSTRESGSVFKGDFRFLDFGYLAGPVLRTGCSCQDLAAAAARRPDKSRADLGQDFDYWRHLDLECQKSNKPRQKVFFTCKLRLR
jgi:hypothetical protein